MVYQSEDCIENLVKKFNLRELQKKRSNLQEFKEQLSKFEPVYTSSFNRDTVL